MRRTVRFRLVVSIVMSSVGLVGACTAAAPSASSPSASPAPSFTAPPPVTASPSNPAASSTAAPHPPTAWLGIAGGARVAGSLGTYTFGSAGSDAPWLPGADIAVKRTGAATLELAPRIAVAAWRVKIAPTGDVNGTGAKTIASGTGAVAFQVSSRTGTVLVEVDFGEGIGSAAYFWRLVPG